MLRNDFFVIEGLDGSGKTTLSLNLEERGYKRIKTPSDSLESVRGEFHGLGNASFFYYMASLLYSVENEISNHEKNIFDRYIFSTITHYIASQDNPSIKEWRNCFEVFGEYLPYPEITFFLSVDLVERKRRVFGRTSEEKKRDNMSDKYNDFWLKCVNEYDFSKKIIIDGKKSEKDLVDLVVYSITERTSIG